MLQLPVRARLARARAKRGDVYDRRTTDALFVIGGTILAIAAIALLVTPAGVDRGTSSRPGLAPGEAGGGVSELVEPAFAPFLADGVITAGEYRAAVDELFRCFDARAVEHSPARWVVSGRGERTIEYTTLAGSPSAVDACEAPFFEQVLIPWQDQWLRAAPTEAEVAAWRPAVVDCVEGYGFVVADFAVVLRLAAGGLGEPERAAADACLVATPLGSRP